MSGREEIDENNLRKLQIGPPPRVVVVQCSVCSMQHIGQTDGRCTVALLNPIPFRFPNLVLNPSWGKEAKRYEKFEGSYSVTIETKFQISDFQIVY